MTITAQTLANVLRIPQPDAQQLLRTMERRGLVTRHSVKHVAGEGKQPFVYSLEERQLQLLKNLFDTTEGEVT